MFRIVSYAIVVEKTDATAATMSIRKKARWPERIHALYAAGRGLSARGKRLTRRDKRHGFFCTAALKNRVK
jgi:hypothetical protein